MIPYICQEIDYIYSSRDIHQEIDSKQGYFYTPPRGVGGKDPQLSNDTPWLLTQFFLLFIVLPL